jgi:2-polyprenylphenol 6-hydroxylase
MTRHDVIVVGGGVAGAAAALALSRRGFDVALLERASAPVPYDPQRYDPRVLALSPGTVKLLDGLGVWSRIAAQRVSSYERMEVWERSPAQALVFDAAELGVPELGFIVEENLLRAALWAALGAVSVQVDTSPRGLKLESGRPVLDLDGGLRLEAALVVSAEGADSKLREWAGIEPVGWDYPQRAVVCHVETERPHRRTARQRFLPNGPLAFLPLADGRSSIVWSTDVREAEELLALDDAAFRQRLADAFDHQLGAITAATKRLSFPLRLLHASDYVRPGLALIGDSAHVVHPLAGQGINLGLADAQALAEVLDQARVQRKALGNERVLKRYERRRKADNLEMLAMTDGLYRLFGQRAPGWDELRQLGMLAVSALPPLKRRLAQRAMGLG